MLNHEEILRLHRDLDGQKVLSVYLNAEENDPAERRAWRIRLNGMLKDLEAGLGDAPADERKAARSAVERLEGELERYSGLLPERGWVCFATADKVWYAGPSPAPMPDLARWEDGAHITPYMRALKQSRPITVVVADQRRARILEYLHGELNEENVLEAEMDIDSSSSGSSKRAVTRSGMRGESPDDAAQRAGEVATERMLRDVVAAVSKSVAAGHLLLLGGNSEVIAALHRELPDRVQQRSIDMAGPQVDASEAQLKEAVDAAASELSIRLQRSLVDEIIETNRSAGRACVGPERVQRALQAGAVDTLVLSRAFARANPDLAERLVDAAFDQGGDVEEIGEAATGELDREGGVGARLRFAV